MIADAPARAQVQNIMNFNGRYGCNICEIRTVRAKKIDGKKTCRIYPFKIDCRLRTGTRMEAQAQKLLKSSPKNQIRGVKGYSSMSCLPLVDVGTCVLPEYMHSVLLGVIKQFVSLHVDKPGLWSIKNKMEEINNFILGIQPPDSFSRLPRELSQYNLYKAYEFYNYLFFYSVPLLSNYLPEKYFQHWLLLVKAIHNLVKDTIEIADLEESDKLLKLFVSQIENLYNDRQLTYNVHQLVHLVLCVKRWGPLRGTSAFAFENYNGFIAKCVHGKKHFAQEIVNNIQIAQGVQLLKNRINENSGNFTEINELKNYQASGKISNFKFSDKERYLFHSKGFDLTSIAIYSRAKINTIVYTSEIYKIIKTNNYTVLIKADDSIIYGTVRFFAEIEEDLWIVIHRLTVDHTKIFYHEQTRSKIEHIVPVQNSDNFILINLKNINLITQLVRVSNYVCKNISAINTVW
ncbi:GSCOCG00012389001-RA-CDS [Cotesia congregata]|nr:GSCOCG00012389001-RA-CDS [Cotesia congregata]